LQLQVRGRWLKKWIKANGGDLQLNDGRNGCSVEGLRERADKRGQWHEERRCVFFIFFLQMIDGRRKR